MAYTTVRFIPFYAGQVQYNVSRDTKEQSAHTQGHETFRSLEKFRCDNDPSAGSPTETLLRLHLPLND